MTKNHRIAPKKKVPAFRLVDGTHNKGTYRRKLNERYNMKNILADNDENTYQEQRDAVTNSEHLTRKMTKNHKLALKKKSQRSGWWLGPMK